MQQALRPYVTAGIALVGAGMIAVTPVAPPPDVQVRQVKLVNAWSTLITDTTANLQSIFSNADTTGIAGVFSALLTNPLGVIEAFTNLDPTINTVAGVPLQVSVELPPALEMLIAQFGAEGATLDAINGVVAQLQSDPSNAFNILYEGTASILNAYLNGEENVSILGGIINIPLFNGILAPLQTMSVDLNLTDLINALGLGDLSLTNLDLSSLLSQLGLGDLNLGQLFDDLLLNGSPLSDAGLGTLLADASTPVTTLGGLLDLLGLGSLTTETLTTALTNAGLLTGILDTPAVIAVLNNIDLGTLLGLDTNITSTLNNALNLGDLIKDLGISGLPLNLSGLGDLTGLSLDGLLGDLGLGDLANIQVDTFGGLATLLAETIPQQILNAI